MKEHYKPNLCYELLIHGTYHYIGCHTLKINYLTELQIKMNSGNYLWPQIGKCITRKEYLDSIELLSIEEYDTKDEALNREVNWIRECKEKYGDLCKNKAMGNKLSNRGLSITPCSEKNKKQLSITRQGSDNPYYGKHHSEEWKQHQSEIRKGKKFYTNGTITVCRYECPEGFWRGKAK